MSEELQSNNLTEKNREFGVKESLFLRLIINPHIAPYCINCVDEWMISSDLRRRIFIVVKGMKLKYNGSMKDQFDINSIMSEYISKYEPSEVESDEVRQILDESFKYVKKENINVYLHAVQSFLKQYYTHRANISYKKGKSDEGDVFATKASNFLISPENFFDMSDFDEGMKYRKIDMPDDSKKFKSSLGSVNSTSIHGGYKIGDLVMIVAAPKVGKSTLLCQEGVTLASQGHKVVHFAIGDMSCYDVNVKYLSCLHDRSAKQICIQEGLYEELMRDPLTKEVLVNTRVKSEPANFKTVFQIEASLEKLKEEFDFDVIIIDYDANIRPANDSSMYESGSEIYASLKKFASVYKSVVLVGSQPKIDCFQKEILNETSAAESSRKQHTVDFMITMGVNNECSHVGTLYIPLVRRGESKIKHRLHFCYETSRIQEVSEEDYKQLITSYKKGLAAVKGDTYGL